MATGMSRRVFGSDIPKNIQKKLKLEKEIYRITSKQKN